MFFCAWDSSSDCAKTLTCSPYSPAKLPFTCLPSSTQLLNPILCCSKIFTLPPFTLWDQLLSPLNHNPMLHHSILIVTKGTWCLQLAGGHRLSTEKAKEIQVSRITPLSLFIIDYEHITIHITDQHQLHVLYWDFFFLLHLGECK